MLMGFSCLCWLHYLMSFIMFVICLFCTYSKHLYSILNIFITFILQMNNDEEFQNLEGQDEEIYKCFLINVDGYFDCDQ